jgi:hypothetical protein
MRNYFSKEVLEMKKGFEAIIWFLFLALIVFCLLVVARGQTKDSETQEIIASGGTFTLEKAVIAGGGAEKQILLVSENGTTGQAIAGYRSNGGAFTLYSGFWTPADLAPTAAHVVVGGQVKTADGRGIRSVLVSITFPSGEIRTAVSSSFGYYRFAEIPAGETYIISVTAKRYTFSQPTLVRQILDDTQDLDFVADAPNLLTTEAKP